MHLSLLPKTSDWAGICIEVWQCMTVRNWSFSSIGMVVPTIDWHISLQVSLFTLFLTLDLDFLCATRTAPSHSWRNLAEQVMSTLNLGLQCIGLIREKASSNFEEVVANWCSLVAPRDAAEYVSNFSFKAINSPLLPLAPKMKLNLYGMSYWKSIWP